jgi:predicted nucleic acid-binding protein
MDAARETSLFLSVLTLGEIEKGAAKLADEPRVERIRSWIRQDLMLRFSGRILPVNQDVAMRWGTLRGQAERRGVKLPVIDSLLAATAATFDLTVVTRNTADLERAGVRVLCPWSAAAK